jgi:hypothetical protein
MTPSSLFDDSYCRWYFSGRAAGLIQARIRLVNSPPIPAQIAMRKGRLARLLRYAQYRLKARTIAARSRNQLSSGPRG